MSSSEKYLQLLREAQTIVPDKLPSNFPYSEFQRNLKKYNEADSWYDGTALDETISVEGKEIEKYPVKINPIKGTCARHTAMLFGDIADGDESLITPRTVKKPKSSEAEKELQNKLEDMLIQVWYESNGRDIQLNNGLASQRYGGCVFYAKYDPFSLKTFPVTIEAPSVKFFIGVPNSSNPYDLEEAWIVKPISSVELNNQGFVGLGLFGLPITYNDDDVHWIVEHYTKLIYEVFVDGNKVARKVVLPGTGKVDIVPVGGENKLRIIPIVYIPHIRNAANFYGDNVFDVVTGIVREMNARVADYGDAVSMDSHDIIVTKNVNGAITLSQLLPGVMRVDIGSGINVTGQEAQPDAQSLRKNAMASSAMEVLVKDVLYKQYRRDAIHPAVCDGEDEGSQRSSQTLTTRMWALETHAQMERIEWTAGLNVLARIIIRILSVYAPELGFTDEFAKMRIYQSWYPTLKKDRLDIVNEISTRVGAKVLSPQKAMDMFGDIEDTEAEEKAILEFWKQMAEIQAKQNQMFGGGNNSNNQTPVKQKSN